MSAQSPEAEPIARPPHWDRRAWDDLREVSSPDMLCHAMWIVLDDPARVLSRHHGGEAAPWRAMVSGDWPPGWDARLRSAGRIAAARQAAAQHPGRADRILRGLPARPVHWSGAQWAELEADIDTGLCFEGLWVLTARPVEALRHLWGKAVKIGPPQAELNGGPCWLAGTGPLSEMHTRIVAFAASRGPLGMTRAHVALALGADPTSLPKETINRYLRTLVERGELRREPGTAPTGGRRGDTYYVTRSDSESTQSTQ